jgi:hypothetical protein
VALDYQSAHRNQQEVYEDIERYRKLGLHLGHQLQHLRIQSEAIRQRSGMVRHLLAVEPRDRTCCHSSGAAITTPVSPPRTARRDPDPVLFARWTEYSALSPGMEVMSSYNFGPWDYGDEALRIFRTYFVLHMSLFPTVTLPRRKPRAAVCP